VADDFTSYFEMGPCSFKFWLGKGCTIKSMMLHVVFDTTVGIHIVLLRNSQWSVGVVVLVTFAQCI